MVGKGNNGGDGLVVARLLREDGHEVRTCSPSAPPEELRATPRANLERLPGDRAGAVRRRSALEGSGAVVDALLGTGFEGEPREPVAGAIAAINAQDAPVVACDVPSGVDASTGEVEGAAVRAAVTATFHGSKVGLYVAPGKTCTPGGRGGARSASRAARRPPARAGLISRARARPLPAPRPRAAPSSRPARWWSPAARAG